MKGRDFDVAVVGAGAGGGALAWALTRQGASVLLLEGGPEFDPHGDYHLHRADWERIGFPAKAGSRRRHDYGAPQALSPAHRDLRSWSTRDGRLNPTDERLYQAYHHVCGVGGSTLHFTGEAHRLNPAAMSMGSRFGVAADWPLGYDDLEPSYQQAERVMGVAGPATVPHRPRAAPLPLPAHPLSYASRTLGEGAGKLGLSWGPNPLAVLSRPLDDRPGCNYCGQCQRGCPRTDKGSADVTFIRQARRTKRLVLVTRARVTAVQGGDRDRIRGLVYRDSRGRTHEARARVYVLACGAVETPRLLLASADRCSPDGLANESGLVGRNFMETLSWLSAGLHPQPQASYRGLPGDAICWDYNAPDAIEGVIRGARFAPGVLEADLAGPLNHARRVVGGWGREHHRRMGATFGNTLAVLAIGESLPNGGTYIDLAPDERDEDGMPLGRIHSRLDDNAFLLLGFMARTCRDILEAAGTERLLEEHGTYDFFASTHVFGTCRMGRDAATSVVDPDCRSHRWRNLYITDASVFPSSGGGESPALTIAALALRAAAAIAKGQRRRDGQG